MGDTWPRLSGDEYCPQTHERILRILVSSAWISRKARSTMQAGTACVITEDGAMFLDLESALAVGFGRWGREFSSWCGWPSTLRLGGNVPPIP